MVATLSSEGDFADSAEQTNV